MEFIKTYGSFQPINEGPGKGYYIKVEVRDAKKALAILDDMYRKKFDINGSNYYYFKDEDIAYDAMMDLGARDIGIIDTNIEESLDENADPCWDDYKIGSPKTKISSSSGKRVNNCVPKDESVNEAVSRSDKAIKDLEKQGSQIDYLDDADTATKKIWKKAGINTDDQNTIILYSYVSGSWPDTKKILNKYNVDYKELEDPNSAGESFIVFVKESLNQVNERLAIGLKPLLKLGLGVTKKTGEDALIDLSDKFDDLGDEEADSIASHLNMAIELMQDGYSGDATKKLKQFNKVCKDALSGKSIKSAFENVTEGTYNSKDHIGSTADGQGANAEIYKKGKGYYVVVSGEVDYDFTAKNDKELLQKLDDNEFDSTDILEVNEATDLNDPVLMAIRRMKSEMEKRKSFPKVKKISLKQYYTLMDKEIDLIDQMKDAAKEYEQLDSDMNAEAGQKGENWSDADANRYGGDLDKLQTKIEKLAKQKVKVKTAIMNYRMS
jgi:hypothetical protein